MGLENRSYYRDDPGFGYVTRFSQARSIVVTIIFINVAIFLLDAFTPRLSPSSHWLGNFLALQSDRIWAVWTWLTYGFTHAPIDDPTVGIWHIAGNMLALFFLGRAVEDRMGSQEFLGFYLTSIVVSGLGALLINAITGGGPMSLVGASGGVTAVVAVFILWFPKQTLLIWGVLPIPAWLLGVLMILSNLNYAFSPGSSVSWEAHAIGGLFGVLYLQLGWRLGWLASFGFGQSGGLSAGWLKNLLRQKPKLRLHDPDAAAEKLKDDADRILNKISISGEESLTHRERKILKRYSESIRKQRQL